jgi:hypothetical protein
MPSLQALLAVCDKMKQNIKPIQLWEVVVIKSSMKSIRIKLPPNLGIKSHVTEY